MRSKPLLPPPGPERLIEIVRRHRADRDQRGALDGDPVAALDRFWERLVDTDEARQELIDGLRDNADWTLGDRQTDAKPTTGRPRH